ncbi:MAG: hypothetical protein LBT38_04920 [Deltaproteobacteria bacterium]|nr:hypothetical protein [Deltaproteobacteria bacterium]
MDDRAAPPNPETSEASDDSRESARSDCGLASCPGFQSASLVISETPDDPKHAPVFFRPIASRRLNSPDLASLYRPPRL